MTWRRDRRRFHSRSREDRVEHSPTTTTTATAATPDARRVAAATCQPWQQLWTGLTDDHPWTCLAGDAAAAAVVDERRRRSNKETAALASRCIDRVSRSCAHAVLRTCSATLVESSSCPLLSLTRVSLFPRKTLSHSQQSLDVPSVQGQQQQRQDDEQERATRAASLAHLHPHDRDDAHLRKPLTD